jgi:hypothetical protein
MPSGGPGPISMGDDSDSSSGGFDDDDDDEGGEGFPDIDIAGLLSSEDEDEDEEAMPPPAVTPFSKKRKSNDDEAAAKKSKRSKASRARFPASSPVRLFGSMLTLCFLTCSLTLGQAIARRRGSVGVAIARGLMTCRSSRLFPISLSSLESLGEKRHEIVKAR